MTDWNSFRGAALRIDDFDLPRIGLTIGVGEDELHAFMDVEAAGSGFDSTGRPKMLFEPHVFYRNLGGARRDQAVRSGLAYAKWRPDAYPKDSYPRLVAAMTIDETAALRSASWGLGQVLGENHVAAGYATPQAMVRAFMEDEAAHLAAMVAFLVANHLDDDLRRLAALTRATTPADCVPIVRVYNGSGYAANNYHVRFAASHNRWRAIADTPSTPDAGDVAVLPPASGLVDYPVLRRGDGYLRNTRLAPYVRIAQERLRLHGTYDGEVDGEFGDKTLTAVVAFQRVHDLTADGVIGGFETWPALLASAAVGDVAAAGPGSDRQPDDPGAAPVPPAPPIGFWERVMRFLRRLFGSP
jgi:hypothetical protein